MASTARERYPQRLQTRGPSSDAERRYGVTQSSRPTRLKVCCGTLASGGMWDGCFGSAHVRHLAPSVALKSSG